MQPIQAQKYLNQGGHNAGNGSNGNTGGVQGGVSGFNQGAGNNQATGQGSTQHLRMLVQQIQMAVQAGYLNHQILNQPLAPTTLHLLNQLLSNIKVHLNAIALRIYFYQKEIQFLLATSNDDNKYESWWCQQHSNDIKHNEIETSNF